MRVLITGHEGYIGAVITPMVAAAGHEVIGLDSGLYRHCGFGDTEEALAPVPTIRKDLRDVEADDLRGLDAIIHLGALCNDPLGDLNPELTLDINYRSTVRLAKLAKQAGVQRFLVSSSCSMYGTAPVEVMVSEEAGFNPITAYAKSKVLADREIAALADEKFSPVFLRNSTAYGSSPKLRMDLVLNNLVASAFTTGRVYLKSDGTPWRPLIHISDIGRAFIAAMQAPRETIHNESFNVGGNSENYQMRDLAEFVRDVVPGSRIEYAVDAGPDTRCYRVDFTKIHSKLPGFSLKWNARLGAEELYETFRKVGLRPEDVEGPRFQRVKQIRNLISEGLLGSDLRWREANVPAMAGQA